ncbi:MAG: ribosomal RNA small subunit methyltransferase A [Chloroflexi bacterium]|nr:ribosomal RNA small subunit methyltransferase A [Chloroflexota bacterium]
MSRPSGPRRRIAQRGPPTPSAQDSAPRPARRARQVGDAENAAGHGLPDELLAAQRPAALLRALGVSARRGLGQHFLTSLGPVRRAIAAAELGPDDTVLEVGPGLGILTQALLPVVRRIVAVELDRALAERLAAWRAQAPQLEVIHGDILALDLCQLFSHRGYKVVANLPYNVAAPTLRHLLESPCQPSRLVVMLQQEMAERIVAAPGALSILGVGVQLYAAPRIVAKVPPGAFYPPPKVMSAIVRLDVRPQPALPVPARTFFALVRAGFSLPRKQLRNSLAAGLAREPRAVAEALAAAGIDSRRRPQTLSLPEWGELYVEAQRRHLVMSDE